MNKELLTDINLREGNCPHNFILDQIPSGSDNAISMRELAGVLNTDDRQIRHLIENARIDGYIIAGTNDGLFIPETREELAEYTSRTFSRIQTSVNTLRPALALTGRHISLYLEGKDYEE